jgi:hypothetical protein
MELQPGGASPLDCHLIRLFWRLNPLTFLIAAGAFSLPRAFSYLPSVCGQLSLQSQVLKTPADLNKEIKEVRLKKTVGTGVKMWSLFRFFNLSIS